MGVLSTELGQSYLQTSTEALPVEKPFLLQVKIRRLEESKQ